MPRQSADSQARKMAKSEVAELRRAVPEAVVLPENERMPNSELPVLIFRAAISGDGKEPLLYATFKANDWGGLWSDGIFGYHHFHSNAHEVLGVATGSAVLVLGGEGGTTLDIAEGDVLVLPAGTGHRRIKASPDFLVVGAYPKGQDDVDEYLDKALCGNYRGRLHAVPKPERDPLYGESGPLSDLW